MTDSAPFLEARRLGHKFPGGFQGLSGVSLAFRPGEFVILAGQNGSGKTLLSRMLVGLIKPTDGGVFFKGEPIRKVLDELREKIGLVFQDADSQLIGQSVEDELRFGPENLRLPEEEITARIEEVIDLLDLRKKLSVSPSRLSGGEKRRLAIGGILTLRPDLIILDEPFANLDYPGVVSTLKVLAALKNQGKGIILITHELEKALAHADRLIIMDGGRVAEDGPASEVAATAGKYGIHPLDFSQYSLEEYTWLRS